MMNRGAKSVNLYTVPIDFSERNMLMPRKPTLLLSLLNLVLKPIAGQTSAPSNQFLALPQHPPAHDREAWRVYWKAQGQPWRTEPEIDMKRLEELAQRRVTIPDPEQDIYPFKGMKLSRSDVEWLLATHENGRGPVDWSDESQREREGLDLRGVDLRKVNLSRLPLACMQGGLTGSVWFYASPEQGIMAAAHMENAILIEAHLEGAKLNDAYLIGANLYQSYLEKAEFKYASMERAYLNESHLGGADLTGAHLEGADLRRAHLQGISTLSTNLRKAFFNSATKLEGIILGNEKHGLVKLGDVTWGGVNLSVMKWSQVKMLGDEQGARQKESNGVVKDLAIRLSEYEAAVRANRQLAVALQSQGLNEDAARFSYRAQVLQKRVFWFQMFQKGAKLRQRAQALGAWLFSWFLFLLAGYGYRLGRSFLAYFLIISLFMTIYLWLDPHLVWNEAFVVSMTAFHGRGFSPSTFTPGDPLSFASAAEAFVGLIIEVTFIATLTQRFFSR
jgi:uncharacterized protein YjbI with pentapeptide repeats